MRWRTVLLIGHYFLLSVIYLPVLEKGGGTFLSQISKRSRPWMYISLVIFMVTGIYLMFADPNYRGVGDFGNFWSVMMLVKHLLIVGMIGLGFWNNAFLRVGPMMASNNNARVGHPPLPHVFHPDGDLGCDCPAAHRPRPGRVSRMGC